MSEARIAGWQFLGISAYYGIRRARNGGTAQLLRQAKQFVLWKRDGRLANSKRQIIRQLKRSKFIVVSYGADYTVSADAPED